MNTLKQAGSHLTDAQFTDLLLGEIPSAVTAHLDACARCAEEAQRVSSAIGSFEQQSRLWAERRASTQPVQTPSRSPLLGWLHLPASSSAWSTAAVAVVLALSVGIGLGFEFIHHTPETAAVAPAAATTQSSAIQAATVQTAAAQPAPEISQAPTVRTAASGSRPTHVTPAVKSDNDLLAAIDGELSASAAPSPSFYGLTTVSGHRASSRAVKGIAD